jgi:hypothetical protein
MIVVLETVKMWLMESRSAQQVITVFLVVMTLAAAVQHDHVTYCPTQGQVPTMSLVGSTAHLQATACLLNMEVSLVMKTTSSHWRSVGKPVFVYQNHAHPHQNHASLE